MFRKKSSPKPPHIALIAILALTLVVVAASGVFAKRSPFQPLSIFARALANIEMSYVEPVDQQQLVHGAIRGMMESLDPHTAFLDPEEFQMLEADSEGRFAGVGVEVSAKNGWLTILSVFDNGPAAKAGLRPGDKFLAIEGEDARDLRLFDAVRQIRGEPGTKVKVTIRRPGVHEDLEKTLTRAFIDVTPVETRILSGNVVYIRLEAFQENTGALLRRSLDRAAGKLADKGGVKGVLLDLRDNAGGLLQQAVEVSDEFLSTGVIVTTRGRGAELISQYRARRSGTRPKWPVVVLINEQTASAAEIVAGALKDHERAFLVGARTFGKGSVQNVLELPDGSAVKLTVARYFTPSGVSIQATGIEPDFIAHQPQEDGEPAPLREEELEGHLPAPKTQHAPPSKTDKTPTVTLGPSTKALADDPQAQRGYRILRGMMAKKKKKN